MNLTDLQTALGEWFDTAVGTDTTREQHALKVCEEAGELARAVGCQSTGARGTYDEWETRIGEEAADVILAVTALAHRCGLDLAETVEHRFGQVRHRDPNAPRPPS